MLPVKSAQFTLALSFYCFRGGDMKGDTTLFLEIIIFVIFHKFPRKAPLVKSILSKAMLTKKDTVTQDI